jgi:16S rRNA (cytosine967-C5)-methyltransferase
MNTVTKIHRPIILSVGRALFEIFIKGGYADKVIERYLKAHSKWGSRDRKLFAESVYEVVRHFYRLRYLASLPNPETEQDFIYIWGVYAFEKWGLQDVLGSAFDLSSYQANLGKLKSEPNWVKFSWPEWLDIYMQKQLPDYWPHLQIKLNEMAPVDVRTNTLKVTPAELKEEFKKEGILTEFISDCLEGLVLTERKNVFITEAFKKGYFEVQDRSSQKIAHILDPKPGERVCDACAGAGGKSLHIAALMQNKGRILSMDVVDWKLKELRARASRAGISIVETRLIEGTKAIKRQEQKFDRVLLDVPCSGLGVVRRNPDTKWKLTEEHVNKLLKQQAQILNLYSRMVKPGGVLVYATCSVLPTENEKQIDQFLTENPNKWSLESTWSSLLEPSGDGFFAAKLIRKDN